MGHRTRNTRNILSIAAEPEAAYLAITAESSRRNRDVDYTEEPEKLSVRFTHRRPRPPVASLAGMWSIVVQAEGGCLVVLDHDFSAVNDAEETLLGIERDVEAEATALLLAVRKAAEAAPRVSRTGRCDAPGHGRAAIEPT